MDKKEVMQQLALMGLYTKDAEPPIFKMIKELEASIKEHKRMINYGRKYGQNADDLEKYLKEEEIRLKAYKDIAKLAPTKDAESRVQYVEFKTREGGREGQEKAREKEAELKRQHKEVKLVSASPMMTYFKWEVKDASSTLDGYKFEDPKEIEKAIKEVEKSGHPNMQYLMALKRALELAKQERSTKDASPSDEIRGEYIQEMYRLEKEMARLYRMGQGAKAAKIDQELKKLRKELKELNTKDDDATEHGSVEEFGKNKKTESMPLEKDPTLAQDTKKYKVRDSLSRTKTKYDDEIHRLEVEYMKREDVSTPEKAIKELDRKEKINKRIQELKELQRREWGKMGNFKDNKFAKVKDFGFKKYRDQNNNVWELVNPQGSFWMMECIKGSRKGDTVTFKKEAVESKMELVRDCGPVFTKGTKDASIRFYGENIDLTKTDTIYLKEILEELQMLHEQSDAQRLIKEELKRRRTQDSMEVLRLSGFATDANYSGWSKSDISYDLRSKEDLLANLKDDLKTGEWDGTVQGIKSKEALKSLIHKTEKDIEEAKRAMTKDTLDECMEILRLSGFATDAYDPKKYEGTRRHETNIWYLENEVIKWRSRYESAKDQVTAYRKMVSSGQYGKATTEDLKRAERDLEAARMKLEQSLSMLKKAKG